MTKYATYDYYLADYGGEMTEADFEKSIIKSSAFIDNITVGNIETDTDRENVKWAACRIADFMKDFTEKDGKVLKSVSSDGYSETYEVSEKTYKTALYDITRCYVPTYLLELSI